jgi:hypothetical protein
MGSNIKYIDVVYRLHLQDFDKFLSITVFSFET